LLTQYGYFNIILRKLLSLQKTDDGVSCVGCFVVTGGTVVVDVAGVVIPGGEVVDAEGCVPGVDAEGGEVVFNLSFGAGFGVDELVKNITDIDIDINTIKHTTPIIINLYLSKVSISEGAATVVGEGTVAEGVGMDILSPGTDGVGVATGTVVGW
jgi:hypothetical protein